MDSWCTRRRGRLGFNMLEMVLASVIFASVAVAALGIWQQQHRAVTKAGKVMVGRYLAERLMEQCVAARWTHVDSLAGATPDMIMREVVKDVPVEVVYTGQIDVTDIAADMKLVVVTVTWEGNIGRSSVSMRTYLQRQG